MADYLDDPTALPRDDASLWLVLSGMRELVGRGELANVPPDKVNRLLASVRAEHRLALLVDLVPEWGRLGADAAMLDTLREVSGLP